MSDKQPRGLNASMLQFDDSPFSTPVDPTPTKMTIVNTDLYTTSALDLYGRLDAVKIHHKDLDALVSVIKRDLLGIEGLYSIPGMSFFKGQTIDIPDFYVELSHYNFINSPDPEVDLFDIILDGSESIVTRFIAARVVSENYDNIDKVTVDVPTDKLQSLMAIIEENPYLYGVVHSPKASLTVSLLNGVSLKF